LDSLEAKLNKLENAWETFIMGLANDETIKAGVDILTGILEAINKIIDVISGGSGLRKSIISLGAAFAALKIGGGVFGALLDTAKEAASGSGSLTGSAFVSSLKTTMGERFKGFGEFFRALFPSKKKMKALVE
jgi:hypothetical protein